MVSAGTSTYYQVNKLPQLTMREAFTKSVSCPETWKIINTHEIQILEPPKKGRATIGEKCRKLSLALFDDFWCFWPCAKRGISCLDAFWWFLTWPLSAGPFCNPAVKYGHFGHIHPCNFLAVSRTWPFRRSWHVLRPCPPARPNMENLGNMNWPKKRKIAQK